MRRTVFWPVSMLDSGSQRSLTSCMLGLLLLILTSAELNGISDIKLSTWHTSSAKVTQNYSSREVVPKTVVSSMLRMSILVGLEGSGHHYFIKAVNGMFESNDDISIRATPCINNEAYFTRKSMESTPMAFANILRTARDEMHDLASQEQNLTWPGHLVRLCKEASFPSGTGAQKAVQYIDLRLLAEIADEEGVDLRVIYLKRSAHEMIVANTIHRHFQKSMGLKVTTTLQELYTDYVLVLLTNAAVMHAFLMEIDRSFIVCHNYAHAGEEEQAWTVANFVAPNAAMAEMYVKSLMQEWKGHSNREELPFEGAEVVAARLQHELDSFEYHFCD